MMIIMITSLEQVQVDYHLMGHKYSDGYGYVKWTHHNKHCIIIILKILIMSVCMFEISN